MSEIGVFEVLSEFLYIEHLNFREYILKFKNFIFHNLDLLFK